MPQIIKKNETVIAPFYKNGVTLDFYTITFPSANLTAKLDMDNDNYSGDAAHSPVAVALASVQDKTSIEIIGTPRYASSDTTLVVGIAALGGGYPTDDYNKDGTPVTFASYLQTIIRTGGTRQGFDLNTVTVAANVRGVAL